MIIQGTVYRGVDGEVYHRRFEVGGLKHVRNCPHCSYWTTARPYLRKHIRAEHPKSPQYRRRPKEGWYDQNNSM